MTSKLISKFQFSEEKIQKQTKKEDKEKSLRLMNE